MPLITHAKNKACIEATQGDPQHWYGVKFELVLPEYIRMLNN